MNICLGHFLIVALLMDMINEQNQILFIVSFSDHRQTQKRKSSSDTSPFLESILTWVLDPGRRPAYSVRKHYSVWPVQDDAYCNRVRGCTT